MSKFKVGDRVKVYGNFSPIVYLRGTVGTVVDSVFHNDEKYELTVEVPERGRGIVHPKQLRKLVPAKPKRKIWVVYFNEHGKYWSAHYNSLQLAGAAVNDWKNLGNLNANIVEFIEVRKKK